MLSRRSLLQALPPLLCGVPAAALPAVLPAPGAEVADVYRLPGPWRDDQARPFELAQLAGQPAVMTLAYGACRRICSTSLRLMEQLQQAADRRGLRLQFVVIGIDPASDTPADWADFRRDRRLQRANWHFLSGDTAAVRRVAQRLGVRIWHTGDHLMHDFRIVQLAADGRLARSVDHFGEPVEALLP